MRHEREGRYPKAFYDPQKNRGRLLGPVQVLASEHRGNLCISPLGEAGQNLDRGYCTDRGDNGGGGENCGDRREVHFCFLSVEVKKSVPSMFEHFEHCPISPRGHVADHREDEAERPHRYDVRRRRYGENLRERYG